MDELDEIVNRIGLAETLHHLMVYCSEQAEAESDDDKANTWEEMADEFSNLEKQAEYL
jgi:hypothetical protein